MPRARRANGGEQFRVQGGNESTGVVWLSKFPVIVVTDLKVETRRAAIIVTRRSEGEERLVYHPETMLMGKESFQHWGQVPYKRIVPIFWASAQ